MFTITENSAKVLEFLKKNGVGTKFTTKEVKEALGFGSNGPVIGAITNFVKKGYAQRHEDLVNGETVKTFSLTAEGMNVEYETK